MTQPLLVALQVVVALDLSLRMWFWHRGMPLPAHWWTVGADLLTLTGLWLMVSLLRAQGVL